MNVLLRNSLAALLLLSVAGADAVDWKGKGNNELRAETIQFARDSAQTLPDVRLKKELEDLSAKLSAQGVAPHDWISSVYAFAGDMLDRRYPIARGNVRQREIVLRLLDYPLHYDDTVPGDGPAIRDYHDVTLKLFRSRRDAMLDQVSSVTVRTGVAVWQVYNMGYVIKGPKHTVGIDISSNPVFPPVKGAPAEPVDNWPEAVARRLASRLDVLFITHMHPDHFCPALIREMVRLGKPVVYPAAYAQYSKQVRGMLPEQPGAGAVLLDHTQAEPMEIGGIKVLAFHGGQGKSTPCNVYLLDIDGVRVVHTGDNNDRAQEACLKGYPAVDIVIPASWNEMAGLLKTIPRPAVCIPSHINELSHIPRQRESYADLSKKNQLGDPEINYPEIVLMTWGEGFLYPALKGITQP